MNEIKKTMERQGVPKAKAVEIFPVHNQTADEAEEMDSSASKDTSNGEDHHQESNEDEEENSKMDDEAAAENEKSDKDDKKVQKNLFDY